MRKLLELTIVILGISTLLGCTIVFLYNFFMAYLNGYEITISINTYGEAHIEMIYSILSLPTIFFTTFILLRDYLVIRWRKNE